MPESLFAQLFDISPFPAVVSRLRDHAVLAVNKRTSEMFGIPQEEAIGRSTSDYYVDLTQRELMAVPLAQSGQADDVLLHLQQPNGHRFWALASARLVTWESEPAVLTVFNDISEQLTAERALRASEQRLAAQSNALTELTAQHADPPDRFDERLRDILEVAADTLKAERVSMWRFDEVRGRIECVGLYRRTPDRHESGARLDRSEAPAYFDAIERERVIAAHDAHIDARTRDFRDFYLVPNGIGAMLDVPLRQSRGTIGVLCVEHVGPSRAWTVDEQNFAVSTANLIAVALADEQRRDALARLAESDARARLIVDTAHDAFVGVDSTGRIITWNAQAERTFGWRREEAVGRDMASTIIPPAYRDAHERGMRRFHDSGEAPVVNTRLELKALHRDGHEFPVEITITLPMRQEDGYFFGAFLRDISDRLERDAQLHHAKESAEAATRAKSEFLANMSHELRTPLNGVLGYAQLLQRDRGLSAKQQEALDAISRCGSHLLDLITDVLDLSKIEAGRVDIEETATDLPQLMTDLKYVVAETAQRKGLRLTMAIAPDVPRRVVLDGRHLRQVLLNLIGNAIKFTAIGEVRLAISRTAADRLLFEVIDTGVGIEPESLTEIFRAFTQTEAGSSAGGTGLGLTISHHLVRKMGDDLRVESVLGEGSRFFFALPLQATADALQADSMPAAAEPSLDAHLAPGQHVTALVVDDSTVSRRILASLLESVGVRVITAAGGTEAIRLAKVHRPDVIFMDLRMSDLDGLEATRRLRRDVATAAIPVIAVTASAFGNTRQAAHDAGCSDYLPKPVRAESVFAALQSQLGVRFLTSTSPVLHDVPVAERHDVAERLRRAIAIGDVTDLDGLARELAHGDAAEASLGQQVARLSANFDFEGLYRLADALGAAGGRTRAVD